MADLEKNISNAKRIANIPGRVKTNAPAGLCNTPAVFGARTQSFYQLKFPLASNVFDGRMQGIHYSDFYRWSDVRLRAANLISPTTGEHLTDDWQRIWVEGIDFIPLGAKVRFFDNTWIVVNAQNVSSLIGTAIVRRANAVWATLDYYGNVVEEPFIWASPKEMSTANWGNEYMINMQGYQRGIMQYNPHTMQLRNTTRIILGTSAYQVRGLVNFIREFGDDSQSVHLQHFDLEQVEATEYDDLTRGIADANAFSWEITIAGSRNMKPGQRQTLSAQSVRNGEPVTGTLGLPVTYLWTTTDPEIAGVEPDGAVSAMQEGTATITCTLAQNPTCRTALTLEVRQAAEEAEIRFVISPPPTLSQYDSAEMQAVLYREGEPTQEPVRFSAQGAPKTAWSLVETGENTAKVTCYAPTTEPLTVTAQAAGRQATAQIRLEGY